MYAKQTRQILHKQSLFFASFTKLVKEVKQLKHDNELQNTILGIRPNTKMIESAITIQAVVRGWILRYDKKVFDHSVNVFLNKCRIMIQRKKFQRIKSCAIKMQSVARGNKVRKTPAGKAIKLLRHKNTTLEIT